jgi:hypothetical protein
MNDNMWCCAPPPSPVMTSSPDVNNNPDTNRNRQIWPHPLKNIIWYEFFRRKKYGPMRAMFKSLSALLCVPHIQMTNPQSRHHAAAAFDGTWCQVTRYKYPQTLHYKPVFKPKKHDVTFSISHWWRPNENRLDRCLCLTLILAMRKFV